MRMSAQTQCAHCILCELTFYWCFRLPYFWAVTPGTELLEIRHQASHRQFLKAALTLFCLFNQRPTSAPVLKTFLCLIAEINPFSNVKHDNIGEWMGKFNNQIIRAAPSTLYNGKITFNTPSKLDLNKSKKHSLGVEKVTTAPFFTSPTPGAVAH